MINDNASLLAIKQKKYFSKRLRNCMEQKAITPATLKTKFELRGITLSVGTVYNWLNAKALPNSVLQLILVDILEVTSDSLLIFPYTTEKS